MSLDPQRPTTAHVRIHHLSHGEALPAHEVASRRRRLALDSPTSADRAVLRRRRVGRSLRISGRTLWVYGIFLI